MVKSADICYHERSGGGVYSVLFTGALFFGHLYRSRSIFWVDVAPPVATRKATHVLDIWVSRLMVCAAAARDVLSSSFRTAARFLKTEAGSGDAGSGVKSTVGSVIVSVTGHIHVSVTTCGHFTDDRGLNQCLNLHVSVFRSATVAMHCKLPAVLVNTRFIIFALLFT